MQLHWEKYILISIALLVIGNSAHGMKVVGSRYAPRSFWPPLLWCAHESPASVATRLKEHSITIKDYIVGQLHNARSQTLKVIQTQTNLTDTDIQRIETTLHIVRSFDWKDAQVEFLKKISKSQKTILKHFPEIGYILKECKVSTPFELRTYQEFPLDVYAARIMNTMIFDIEKVLMLALPDVGTFHPTQLIIGPSYDQLRDFERDGALARVIGGDMHLEHATERYLFKEVMKKRITKLQALNKSLNDLEKLHELESDLIPASKNAYLASCILAWLELETTRYLVPNGEERMQNLNVVIDLHHEYSKMRRERIEGTRLPEFAAKA